jgi:hypothetical protein
MKIKDLSLFCHEAAPLYNENFLKKVKETDRSFTCKVRFTIVKWQPK